MLDKDGSGVVTFSEFKAGILQGEGFVHGAGQQHGVCRQTAVLLLSLIVTLAGIVLISNVFISLTDTSLRSQYGQILGSAVTLASYEAESRLQDMEQIAHAEAGIWARGMFAPWTPSAVSVAAAAAAAAAAANGGATPAPPCAPIRKRISNARPCPPRVVVCGTVITMPPSSSGWG